MAELTPWPFPLPERFTEALGYERAAGPACMPERLRASLRRTNMTEAQIAEAEQTLFTRRPRRWVAFYWEPAGDELGWTDGVAGGAGQLAHWVFLDYLHRRGPGHGLIYGWLSSTRSISAAPRPPRPTGFLLIATTTVAMSRPWRWPVASSAPNRLRPPTAEPA